MGKPPVFSRHAKLRLTLRKISAAEVILTIREPDASRPGRDGATNYWKLVNGRTIRVTIAPDHTDPEQPVVVTVAIKETT